MHKVAVHHPETLHVARLKIDELLCEGAVSSSAVAGLLGLSLRTLQRRLAEQGTSFSALLDEVRREHTLALLAIGAVSIGDLSDRLGYKQPSAFTRAVRRWTGKTPTQVSLHKPD